MRSLPRAAIIGILLLPLLAAAEGARVCTPPDMPLKRGMSSDSVANLQIFLAREKAIYPSGIVSGYFGPATERAIGAWQIKYGVVPQGTTRADGLGMVGPRTIAMLKQLWECDGSVTFSWFNASMNGGTASFSAQASSAYPINPPLLYVDFGDGAKGVVTAANAVCKTVSGSCSTILSAAHAYKAGTFTAKLMRVYPTDRCGLYSPAWICAQAAREETLGTVNIASNGAAPAATASQDPATRPDPLASVASLVVPASYHPAVSGSIARSGGALTVSWAGTSTPVGTSAELLLYDAGNNVVGTIERDLLVKGSHWWTIPRTSSGACATDAITCLLRLSGTSCSGSICPLDNGSYAVVARLMYGGNVAAASRIGSFSLEGGDIIVTASASSPTNSQSEMSLYGAAHGTTAVQRITTRSCDYSGVQYGEGVTLNLSCADLAGGSCSLYGGQALTCRSGAWVNASGTAVLIPNVTSFSKPTGSSCRTPWGSQSVQSGNQIVYEPFFTGGNYSGIQTMPLMQCTNGQWQKCDWQGANCGAYIPSL